MNRRIDLTKKIKLKRRMENKIQIWFKVDWKQKKKKSTALINFNPKTITKVESDSKCKSF